VANDETLIKNQIEYYRARAHEYDEWVYRLGRYDRGKEQRRQWLAEMNLVRDKIKSSQPDGKILELACGTGLWTQYLAPYAEKLIAIDTSSEAIEINRQKVANSQVKYLNADLFSWQPSECFDYIFFGFWLSHVPLSHFDNFWNLVRSALTPNGRVFFVDSLLTQESTAKNHKPLDRSNKAWRKLNDGREFEIVKVFHKPLELKNKLMKRGWIGYVQATKHFFLYGCVCRERNLT
jgi:demethylmenaquinone methyltransferase/2-methoxy-6-polyprenyl-1,4-benzoquinol methylase